MSQAGFPQKQTETRSWVPGVYLGRNLRRYIQGSKEANEGKGGKCANELVITGSNWGSVLLNTSERQYREHALAFSNPMGKSTGLLIHHFLSIIDVGMFQRHNSPALRASLHMTQACQWPTEPSGKELAVGGAQVESACSDTAQKLTVSSTVE